MAAVIPMSQDDMEQVAKALSAPPQEPTWEAFADGVRIEGFADGTTRVTVLMTLARAQEVSGQCVRAAAECGGLVPVSSLGPTKLPDVSLAEMLLAARIVSASNDATRVAGLQREVHVVCDPRIVAAVYAFEHYGEDPRQLMEALGFSVAPKGE